MVRVPAFPTLALLPIAVTGILVLLSGLAAWDHAWFAATALGTLAVILAVLAYESLGVVTATVWRSLKSLGFRKSYANENHYLEAQSRGAALLLASRRSDFGWPIRTAAVPA